MRAAWFERYGPAREVLRVGELPTPAAAAGEVRVRLHASGINPSDVKRRAGIRDREGYPRIIPHSDGAGVVDAVGADVAGVRVGDRVWIHGAQRGRPLGTAAEHVTLAPALTAPLPDGVDYLTGAGLGVPALTAHVCVFADGPVAGRDVLVTGGAGAVGFYAIQLARLGGARVLTTVSSPEKAALARQAGADVVIDYRREDVVARVRAATGGGVDRVVEVDFGANLAVTERVLKDNAVVAAYASMAAPAPVLPFYPLMFRNVALRMVALQTVPLEVKAAAATEISRWCAGGALRHPPLHVLPLDAIVEAHELVESGTVIGKVVLEIK